MSEPSLHHIAQITCDEAWTSERSRDLAQEREVAISDLLVHNHFAPKGSPRGAYHLHLSVTENRLVFDVDYASGRKCGRFVLSLVPFTRKVKEYLMIVESYNAAIRDASRQRIETLDMARRGLHDDGARLLTELLEDKVEIDFATARRLFTLICVLHMKG